MLAQALRGLRRQRGWRQEDLSAVLGVSQTTVARWETGGRPAQRHLPVLAEALGLTVVEVAALAALQGNSMPDEAATAERLSAIEERLDEVTRIVHEVRELLARPQP